MKNQEVRADARESRCGAVNFLKIERPGQYVRDRRTETDSTSSIIFVATGTTASGAPQLFIRCPPPFEVLVVLLSALTRAWAKEPPRKISAKGSRIFWNSAFSSISHTTCRFVTTHTPCLVCSQNGDLNQYWYSKATIDAIAGACVRP